MADAKEKPLLLERELTIADCVMLDATMRSPGFSVLTRLYEAACAWANNESIKLDPEDPNYDKKLAVRMQRTRNFNEMVQYVRLSALTHVQRVEKQKQQENEAAETAVASVFGIHPAKPGTEPSAIEKTFGIHPAKPPKKKQAEK
jgi:hypothetical protein